jgi:hypothetical protein
MGGATYFTDLGIDWEGVFSNVISGQMTNVFSRKDKALTCYKFSMFKKPIGKKPFFNDSQANYQDAPLEQPS